MPRAFMIPEEPLATEKDLVARGSGRHLLREDLAGAKIYVQVADEEIVGFSAERNGQEVEIVYLQMRVGEDLASSRRTCVLCVCDEQTCFCVKVEPDGPVSWCF